MKCNVGKIDRLVRVIIGLGVIIAGFYFKSWLGLIGLLPILTAAIGWCPAYLPIKLSTTGDGFKEFKQRLDKTLSEKQGVVIQLITGSGIWKSFFRHGYADTEKNQSLEVTSNVLLHLHPVKTKSHGLKVSYTWCMGGITFFLFIIVSLTGIFLMFYYRPVVEHAYMDMKTLRFDVPFGILLRNIHRWGAHLMVLTVMLHMIRVFLTGSYKAPREFNWVVGVVLLICTLLMSFTGYLLPWDQLAYWAITVGSNMASATPVLGFEGPFSIVTK